jgi:hypothetical protein
MTDETDGVAGEGPTDPPAQPRRPSPGAQAASRARRIGGRPLPAPRPTDVPTDAGDEAPAGDPPAADLGKTADPATSADDGAARDRPAEDAAPDDATPPGKERKARRPGRWRWVPAGVAGLAAAALLGVSIWQADGVWWNKPATASSLSLRTQVLAAAKTCGAAVTSYDYKSFAASEQAGLACTTGDFTTQYKTAMEQTVKNLAVQSQTTQNTQVAKAGIQSVSPDGKQWVILVYGQQVVSNKATDPSSPRLDQLTMQVTMTLVGKAWLVSSIQQVD